MFIMKFLFDILFHADFEYFSEGRDQVFGGKLPNASDDDGDDDRQHEDAPVEAFEQQESQRVQQHGQNVVSRL